MNVQTAYAFAEELVKDIEQRQGCVVAVERATALRELLAATEWADEVRGVVTALSDYEKLYRDHMFEGAAVARAVLDTVRTTTNEDTAGRVALALERDLAAPSYAASAFVYGAVDYLRQYVSCPIEPGDETPTHDE